MLSICYPYKTSTSFKKNIDNHLVMFNLYSYKQTIVHFRQILFFCNVIKLDWYIYRSSCLLFLLLFVCTLGVAQINMGIPDIRNYTRLEYKAGSQNWGIGQDRNGIMYFGNNEGLLSYDGNNWRLYPLPIGGNVRSLAIDSNRIYVGGQEEIGFFAPGARGELIYTSLKENIPKDIRHDFADVWNVVVIDKKVFFRSNRHIFIYENDKIRTFQSKNWSFLGKVDNRIFGFDDSKGLCEYNGARRTWDVVIDKNRLPANVQLSTLLKEGSEIWIVTYNQGIIKWNGTMLRPFSTPAIEQLKSKLVNGAVKVSDAHIAFVTNLSGSVLLDTSGHFVHVFAHKDGLQNNNAICSFVDKDKNLWLGLGEGIDVIEYNKPIRRLAPGEDGPIAGYASVVFQDYLFLGTAMGVYKIRYNPNDGLTLPYESVASASGQIWNLTNLQEKLWIGENKTAMIYEHDAISTINKSPTGFWNFQQIPGTNYVASGTYNGIHYFKTGNGNVSDIGVEALFESAKYVAIDNRTIWAMHPYKGLYKVDLSNDGLPIKTTHIQNATFLSASNNHLFKIGQRVVVTSDNGIFEWDAARQTFLPSAHFAEVFGGKRIDYLKENDKGDYWFIEKGKMGIALKQNGTYRLLNFPDLNGRLQFGENEDISLLNDSCAIVAAEKGFFYINAAKYQQQEKDFNLLIRSFHIQTPTKDSVLFGGYASADMPTPELAYKFNSVLFTYSVPVFGYAPPIQYSYKLEGFDQYWSSWTEKTEKNYTNLPPGKYTFSVKAKSELSGKEKETNFEFVVLAPWYRTNLAYVLYVALLIVSMYFFSKYQHRRYIAIQTKKLEAQQKEYAEKQKELELQHSLAQEKKEKQLAELANEKLAMELEMKNTAIASNAMLLVQKSELLSKVKKDLAGLLDGNKEDKTSPQIKKIIRTVDAELNSKEDWDKFASHFDTVHENYLKKLKEAHPQLTYGDLKLCALLRLGMSSKEIAGVLNISLKGVEVSRYRLRKKLNMGEEQSLFDFLSQ